MAGIAPGVFLTAMDFLYGAELQQSLQEKLLLSVIQ